MTTNSYHMQYFVNLSLVPLWFLLFLPVFYTADIPHPPWPLLISDVGLELEGTLINCSLL